MPKFKVTGVAFVPVQIEMTIDAPTGIEAMRAGDALWAKSRRGERRDFIVANSQDDAAVADFQASGAEPA